MVEIPDRVNPDQYKKLCEHWLSDKAIEISQKNKESRKELKHSHRMGKKSIAVKREILKKKIGRHPTRGELFKDCYCGSDGVPTNDLRNAIEEMEKLAPINPSNSNINEIIYGSDDDFATVMGKDKDGQVRMFGTGVNASDVTGGKPSRAALIRQSAEYKEKYLREAEKIDALNAKIDNLTTYVHERSQFNGQYDYVTRVASPNGLSNSPSPPRASMNNRHSSSTTSCQVQIRVALDDDEN